MFKLNRLMSPRLAQANENETLGMGVVCLSCVVYLDGNKSGIKHGHAGLVVILQK